MFFLSCVCYAFVCVCLLCLAVTYWEIVHEPRGVTMHPLRGFWEWYNIVHWTSLIKNQDVNTRYIGSHPPFDGLRMAAMEKDKMHI